MVQQCLVAITCRANHGLPLCGLSPRCPDVDCRITAAEERVTSSWFVYMLVDPTSSDFHDMSLLLYTSTTTTVRSMLTFLWESSLWEHRRIRLSRSEHET